MLKKTVFILGAGFSYNAQIPLQSELLNEILCYTPTGYEEADILDSQNTVKKFIEELFGSTKGIALEDIFTILDRSVITKERFKSYTWMEIFKIRKNLVNLILHLLHKKQEAIPAGIIELYLKFAKLIINKRKRAGQKRDPIGIISSNWDTISELFLNKVLTKSQKKNTSIDYCIFTHGKGIPHINLKSKNYYNIKILKLHGSLNWLNCSNCGRIFVDDGNISIQKIECQFCNTASSGETKNDLLLEPLIITPTLLKELTNLHIKNIWQNAFIELQEACDIYFIGYSLPYADFEFKYILKKAIRKDANLYVVLSSKDKKNGTMKRYKDFFGSNIKFNLNGFKGWIEGIESF